MALALPSGPRGRVMALGLTFVVIVMVWLGLVQPVIDQYNDGADTLERRNALAQRMSDVADTLPQLQAQAKASAVSGPPVNATLDGNTDSIAGANLESLIEGMASTAGAHLTSTEALPAEAVGEYRRISLRVSVDATWNVLIRLLQAIEHATPRMFIDDLQLHAQPTAIRTRELPLDISFTVLAFRPTATSEPAQAAPRPPAGDQESPSPIAPAPADANPAAAAPAQPAAPPPGAEQQLPNAIQQGGVAVPRQVSAVPSPAEGSAPR